MQRTDQELISAYESGDEASLAILIERYLPNIFSFLFRITGSRRDAEDVTQETWVKAWRYLHRYKKEQSFRAWIFTLAHHAAIDFLRRRKNVSFTDLLGNEDDGEPFEDQVTDERPLPDELFAAASRANLLEEALGKISLQDNEVLLLHYTEGLTFEEIGILLKKPLHTVKSQHRRALQKLRDLLEAPKFGL